MLSPLDMIVIGGAALIFFGPDQLPSVARKVGSVVRELQMTSQSFIREMERAADDAEAAQAARRLALESEPVNSLPSGMDEPLLPGLGEPLPVAESAGDGAIPAFGGAEAAPDGQPSRTVVDDLKD